jgi:heat shock protein HtpX
MAAYGLYSHIQSNKRRSIALLVGLFALVYLLVYAGALAGEAMSYSASMQYLVRKAWQDLIAAAPLATVGTVVWIIIAYYFHQTMIDLLTGGREVSRAEEPRLYNLLENLCISRGITMPKIKIMESDALNAFATGMNKRQYVVTATSGLVAALDDAELEAVLGHELTHIRNGDVRLLVVALIIAGAIAFFAELFFRLWFYTGFRGRRSSDGEGDRGRGGNFVAVAIAIVLVAIAWLLSSVIRFALSRSREFLADAGSVELTKNPDAMILALRKIEGRGDLQGATSAVMEMCVDNPREGFTDLFSTHPSIEARIKALVEVMGRARSRPAGAAAPAGGNAIRTSGRTTRRQVRGARWLMDRRSQTRRPVCHGNRGSRRRRDPFFPIGHRLISAGHRRRMIAIMGQARQSRDVTSLAIVAVGCTPPA